MARTNDITAIGQRESFFIYCSFDRINKYQLVFILISTNEIIIYYSIVFGLKTHGTFWTAVFKKWYEEKITFQILIYKMLGFTWPISIRSKHIYGVSNSMEIIGTQINLKPRCDKPNNNSGVLLDQAPKDWSANNESSMEVCGINQFQISLVVQTL